MPDVINYVVTDYNIGFPTGAKFKCNSCPSGPTEHSQPPEENNLNVNQDNYPIIRRLTLLC